MKETELKKTLRQFDDIPLPSKYKILSNCSEAFAKQNTKQTRLSPRRRALVAACACVCVLMSLLSVNALALERQEYANAVAFFEQNGLSTDGFSRGELIRICKDISSESFTYKLTFEAIRNSLGLADTVNHEALTPEEIKALWDKKQTDEDFVISHIQNGLAVSGSVAQQGVSFLFKVQIRNVNTLQDTYSVLEKYADGKLEWAKTISAFSISKVLYANEHIVLAGTAQGTKTSRAILLLSEKGEIVWQNPVEDIANILIEEDGISIIGNGLHNDTLASGKTKSKLYIAQFNWNGELVRSISETFYNLNFDYIQYLEASYQEPSYSVDRAIKVGDSYYLVLSCYIQSGNSVAKTQMSIAKVSEDGYFEAMYEINEPLTSHRITDIAIKGDDLFIGGYYLPSANGPLDNGLLLDKTEELNDLKTILIDTKGSISNQMFLDMIKDHYTGFVVCCDIQTGEAKQLKIIEGAKDVTFDKTTAGSLVLNCKTIADAKYVIAEGGTAPWNAPPYAKIEIVYQSTSHVID
ncbi:MAG: hypothetical protein IJW09_05470 [Clostridia bacterium]|nr:hypothetical protein [Clostridia bacterium]